MLYTCDPSINETCSKSMCHINGGPCIHTTNIKHAKQPIKTFKMVVAKEDFVDLVEEVGAEDAD